MDLRIKSPILTIRSTTLLASIRSTTLLASLNTYPNVDQHTFTNHDLVKQNLNDQLNSVTSYELTDSIQSQSYKLTDSIQSQVTNSQKLKSFSQWHIEFHTCNEALFNISKVLNTNTVY